MHNLSLNKKIVVFNPVFVFFTKKKKKSTALKFNITELSAFARIMNSHKKKTNKTDYSNSTKHRL